MTIKYSNIKENGKLLTVNEQIDYCPNFDTMTYLAFELSNFLTETEWLDSDHFEEILDKNESYPLSNNQVKAIKTLLMKYFDCLNIKPSTKKETVLLKLKDVLKSFKFFNNLLVYEELDGRLNPIDICTLTLISKCNPKFQIIIEECVYDDEESILIRHYLFDGKVQSIKANVLFVNEPIAYNSWNS